MASFWRPWEYSHLFRVRRWDHHIEEAMGGTMTDLGVSGRNGMVAIVIKAKMF
jgi:hypothetical protein